MVGWWDGIGAATPAMAANVCVLVPRSSCMGRLHGLTHIRNRCVQKQTSASAHSTYTHMLASVLRRYSDIPFAIVHDRISNFKRSSACELVVGPSRVPHRPHKIVCVEDLSGHFCQTRWMCHLEKPAIHGGRSNRMHHHTHTG